MFEKIKSYFITFFIFYFIYLFSSIISLLLASSILIVILNFVFRVENCLFIIPNPILCIYSLFLFSKLKIHISTMYSKIILKKYK